MQLLILPGTYDCANLGDLAMLEVALRRLRRLWPDSELQVLTHKPTALRRHCPDVTPVSLRGRNRWLRAACLPRFLFPGLPPHAYTAFPASGRPLLRSLLFLWPGQLAMVRSFVNALFRSDLFLMAGCGVLADPFAFNARRILATFNAAHACAIPTALLSQGIGPITDPGLAADAARVLPRMRRIFIRESRTSLPLLHSLGVRPEAIRVTGDDALSIPSPSAPAPHTPVLGLNLRVARYSGLNPEMVQGICDGVHGHARAHSATLRGLPILCGTDSSDVATLQALAGKSPVPLETGGAGQSTADLAARVSGCRAVITGSYHGAVFALAQGIPVVCLAATRYYADKFLGLREQFDEGCEVLDPSQPDLRSRLPAALERAWNLPDSAREALRARATARVRSAEAAYAELEALIEVRSHGRVGS